MRTEIGKIESFLVQGIKTDALKIFQVWFHAPLKHHLSAHKSWSKKAAKGVKTGFRAAEVSCSLLSLFISDHLNRAAVLTGCLLLQSQQM